MQLAWTIVVPIPSHLFVGLWVVMAVATLGLWLWGSSKPQTLAQRTLDAAWWACAPTAALCVPLVAAMGAYTDPYLALAHKLEPAMLLPLDLSVLGTLYLSCFLAILGWRARPEPVRDGALEEPVLTQTR